MQRNVAGQRVQFTLFSGADRIDAPTLAAADFRVDVDGGGQNPVAVTPTSDAAGLVTWLPSQAETNGDYVTLLCQDAVGDEWDAVTITFDTRAETTVATNLDAAVSTRAVAGDAMTLTAGERTSIGTAVWAATTRTLTAFGTLVADIWAYVTRTLTQTAVSLASSTALDLILYRHATNTVTLTGLSLLETRTEVYFTVKRSKLDDDSAALIQVSESGGLLVLNGAPAADPTGATLVVAGDRASAVITLSDATMAALGETGSSCPTWDLKEILPGGARVPATGGTCTITAVVTHAVAP